MFVPLPGMSVGLGLMVALLWGAVFGGRPCIWIPCRALLGLWIGSAVVTAISYRTALPLLIPGIATVGWLVLDGIHKSQERKRLF